MDLSGIIQVGLDVLHSRLVVSYGMLLLLIVLRLTPILAFTPVFGGESTPRRFRIGLALLLAAAVTPFDAGLGVRDTAGGELLLLAVKELLIGITMALFVRILFDMIAAVGSLIDMSRGASMMQMFDPMSRSQQTPLALFHSVTALALFFSIGGHHLLLSAIVGSLQVAPPTQLLPGRFLGEPAVSALIGLFADLFALALQLAAPVIVVMFITDVALGMMDRIAQGIQVFFLGMPLKGLLGVWIVFLSIGFTLNEVISGAMARIAAFFAGG